MVSVGDDRCGQCASNCHRRMTVMTRMRVKNSPANMAPIST
jgi:hypothetical protein